MHLKMHLKIDLRMYLKIDLKIDQSDRISRGFCRHLALLARCHMFSRQATRTGDLLYTYSVVEEKKIEKGCRKKCHICCIKCSS
jgi:hypothetical protein